MYNCIFSAHCTELFCDNSCPNLTETSYLLERNGIKMNSFVFGASQKDIDRMTRVLKKYEGRLGILAVPSPEASVKDAELLTYCAICQNWQGSQLHCTVYNLKYSKYMNDTKQSWSMKSEPESLEYTRIWSESAKVLIVSSLDYVNFGDFESQTLLNLFQSRSDDDKTTIVVRPKTLLSPKGSVFFNALKSRLDEVAKGVNIS